MVDGKTIKGLPTLRRPKISKKHKRRRIYVYKYIYMKLVGGVMIVDPK